MESVGPALKDFRDAVVWDRLVTGVVVVLITGLWSAVWGNLRRLPQQGTLGRSLSRRARWLAAFVDPYLLVEISDRQSTSHRMWPGNNVCYEEAEAYLSASCSSTARRLRAEGVRDGGDAAADSLVLSMLDGEEVSDLFHGVTVWWSAKTESPRSGTTTTTVPAGQEKRWFELHYHQRHRDLVLKTYLRHVRQEGRRIMDENRQRRIFTNLADHHEWRHEPFKHPMKFDKLAMDPEEKKRIIDDLDTFKKGKERYERVGKAWKRGYLLYGPPGTGKSAMIAAMANHLAYDVYFVELMSLKSNFDLQMLLMKVKSKAIVVIEDIDCAGSGDLTGAREKKKRPAAEDDEDGASPSALAGTSSRVTLSGLLNVVDGLMSACGEERIFVFTTNYMERLDEALIRRGRMDKHIDMSYCGFEAFKLLAKMYLDVDAHTLFDAVGELLREVEMTPVDVIEELTTTSQVDDADARADKCLKGLVKALLKKKVKKEKTNGGSTA